MANKKARLMMVAGLLVIASVGQAAAAEIVLNHVVFPERRDVDLEFVATPRAPRAELRADVRYRGRAAADGRGMSTPSTIAAGTRSTTSTTSVSGRRRPTEALRTRGSASIRSCTPRRSTARRLAPGAIPAASWTRWVGSVRLPRTSTFSSRK